MKNQNQPGFEQDKDYVVRPNSWFGADGFNVHLHGGPLQGFVPDSSASVDRFQAISINYDDFPTNKFVHEFLLSYTIAGSDLKRFYAPTAIFSLTVESAKKSSPLLNYLRDNYSRNNLDTTDERFFQEPKDIVEAQENMFPNGISWIPNSLYNSIISPGFFGVVLHGHASTNDQLTMKFTRSFIIGMDDENTFIMNDHIYLEDIISEL